VADDEDGSERADGVHRLVDMVVEEVSLVDRAANQRRFLIVKRRFEMAGEGAGGEAAGAGKEEGGVTGGTEAMTALAEAVTALAELATTNEAEKAFPPPKKPKKPTGEGGEDEGDDDDDEDDDEPDEDEKAEAERRRKAAESVQALLGQVKAALGRLQAAVTAPTQKRDPAPGGADALMAKLDAIAGSITKLETQLKDQGERIGKVEKNVGLPASRTPEGKPTDDDDDPDAVSWPLDLNAPMDRDHVTKDVSFHEISK
jgi:hypothetical protein